jgi:hypothetical protein
VLEVLGIIAGVISAVVVLGGLVWKAGRRLGPRVRPFRKWYKVLGQLELGVRAEYLKGLLGEPEVSYDAQAHLPYQDAPEVYLCEYYRRPGHVIGTLTNASGSVTAIAVGSCDPKFRGKVPTPMGPIRLNNTTMAEVGQPSRVLYSVGGSGGFNYYVLDVLDGQCNAAGYTDTLWGQIYGCCDDSSVRASIRALSGSEIGSYSGDYDPSLDRYRSRWTTNLVVVSQLPMDTSGGLAYPFITGVEGRAQAAARGMRRRGCWRRRWRR